MQLIRSMEFWRLSQKADRLIHFVKLLFRFVNFVGVNRDDLGFLSLVALTKLACLRTRMAKVSNSLSRYTDPVEKCAAI